MKIGLQTWGTVGDFMPFLALAKGLAHAKHDVLLAYTSVDDKDYSEHNDVSNIQLIRANGNTRLHDRNPYEINAKPGSFAEYTKLLRAYFEPFTEAMYNASEKLCSECDMVIGHAACHTLLTASQKFQVPRVSVVLVPLMIESKRISPIGNNLGLWLNSIMWSVGDKVSTALWFDAAKKLRTKEGLPSIKSLQKELFTSDVLTLVASSLHVTPHQPDWEKHVKSIGFLASKKDSAEEQLSVSLRSFIENGEPPIYMTFGSCMQFDLKDSTQLLIDTARQLKRRVIIQSDWLSVSKPTDADIFCIGNNPHLTVFRHCNLIVHHGGAGTTQAALLAGKPSIIVAHGFDQLYWGKQLERQYLGGKPLLRESVNSSTLVTEIENVLNSVLIKDKAITTGRKMQQENGVQNAIFEIEKAMSK